MSPISLGYHGLDGDLPRTYSNISLVRFHQLGTCWHHDGDELEVQSAWGQVGMPPLLPTDHIPSRVLLGSLFTNVRRYAEVHQEVVLWSVLERVESTNDEEAKSVVEVLAKKLQLPANAW